MERRRLSLERVRGLLLELDEVQPGVRVSLDEPTLRDLCQDWLERRADPPRPSWKARLGGGLLLFWSGLVLGVILSRWWGI